jgi:hypothetical protein
MKRGLALLAPLLLAAAPAPITPAELSATVKEIASEPYQGRAPGTPGETKTIAYLIGRLQALGLSPGGPAGAWTQAVPMIYEARRLDRRHDAVAGRGQGHRPRHDARCKPRDDRGRVDGVRRLRRLRPGTRLG